MNGLGPLSVKAKRICLLRYGNRLAMTQGILISKGQPCPTSSAASVLVLLLLALILQAVILKYVHMYVSRKLVMKFSCFVIHTVKEFCWCYFIISTTVLLCVQWKAFQFTPVHSKFKLGVHIVNCPLEMNILCMVIQMQQHIPMPTLVRAVVHIIWIMFTAMDMRLLC